MKKSYFFVMTLLLMVAAVGLVSCGDDDEGGVSTAAVVGKWESVSFSAYEVVDGDRRQLDDNVPYEGEEGWEFNADGTGAWLDFTDGDRLPVTWSMSGNRLYTNDGEFLDEFIVEEASGNHLVLGWHEPDEGDGYEYYEAITFRRVD